MGLKFWAFSPSCVLVAHEFSECAFFKVSFWAEFVAFFDEFLPFKACFATLLSHSSLCECSFAGLCELACFAFKAFAAKFSPTMPKFTLCVSNTCPFAPL